jgi:hypothetical protein
MKLAEAPFGIVAFEPSNGFNIAADPFIRADSIVAAAGAEFISVTTAVLFELKLTFVILICSTDSNGTGSIPLLSVQAALKMRIANAVATLNRTKQ